MNAFLGCIVYADDILIVITCLFSQLQEILNICHAFGVEWHISFNAKKSHLCAFGVKTVLKIVLCMGAMNILWCNKFRYLGVMLVG